jgi:hypothetical protein
MREKAECKHEEDAHVQFTFSLNEKNVKVEWKEEGKEFRYKDEMYDVIKTVVHKDSVTYFCLQDKDEKTLMTNFDRLVKNNVDNSGSKKNIIVKDLSKYNFNNITQFYPVINKALFITFKPIFYKSISIDTQSPPPKNI